MSEFSVQQTDVVSLRALLLLLLPRLCGVAWVWLIRSLGCRNEASDGLCSQCYKAKMSEMQLKMEKVSQVTAAPEVDARPASEASPSTQEEPSVCPCCPKEPAPPPAPAAPEPITDAAKEPPRKKNRCAMCNKKVGLLGFKCKCGRLLCSAHRTPEDHDCDFDHQAEGKKQIAEDNPLVAFSKVIGI